MQPFVPPKSSIDKAAIIELRKKQAAEAKARAEATANLNAGVAPNTAKPEDAALLRAKNWIKPEDAVDRLRIIFDNSGSMLGPKLQAAKDGCVEFLRNCTPNATSVAIHLLNPEHYGDWDYETNSRTTLTLPANIEKASLTADIVLLASEILHPSIVATGGSPLYKVIDKALVDTPKATRLIAFSDGCPERSRDRDTILNAAKRGGIPIDTVFIASTDTSFYENKEAISEMKYIAEKTGGIFLDLSKGDIKSGLKYLAPTKRLMLADSSFKSKIEKGEVK